MTVNRHEGHDNRDDAKETGRLEAFSDGVYAVVITLLALDLKVPHVHSGTDAWALAQALAGQWPSYLAFVTSFFTVLIMWVNHHTVFKLVHKSNVHLLFTNGVLLMLTTAVPFTTALVTEYLRLPGAKIACAVYGGTFVLIAAAYNVLWYCVSHDRRLLKQDAPEHIVNRITRNYRFGVPLYLIATFGALASAYVTIGICTAL